MLEAVWFGFLLGLGTFFGPCSAALLPAYVTWFTGLRLRTGLLFSLLASLGLTATLVAGGVAVLGLRSAAGLTSRALGDALAGAGMTLGILFILLGARVVLGDGPSLTARLGQPKRGAWGMFAFGVTFGIGSLACSLPLAIAATGLGAIHGAAPIVAYGVGAILPMTIVGAGFALAQATLMRVFRSVLPRVHAASGWIMIGAGMYVFQYYAG